jgi:hypothetical protein
MPVSKPSNNHIGVYQYKLLTLPRTSTENSTTFNVHFAFAVPASISNSVIYETMVTSPPTYN